MTKILKILTIGPCVPPTVAATENGGAAASGWTAVLGAENIKKCFVFQARCSSYFYKSY